MSHIHYKNYSIIKVTGKWQNFISADQLSGFLPHCLITYCFDMSVRLYTCNNFALDQVKFSVCLTKHHTIQTYGADEV